MRVTSNTLVAALLLAFSSGGIPNLRAGDAEPAQSTSDDEIFEHAEAAASPAQDARHLLANSVAAMKSGRYSAARALAKQAAKTPCEYTLFDTRPDQVLAEIDRRERNAIKPDAEDPDTTPAIPTEPAIRPAAKKTSKKPAATRRQAAPAEPQPEDAAFEEMMTPHDNTSRQLRSAAEKILGQSTSDRVKANITQAAATDEPETFPELAEDDPLNRAADAKFRAIKLMDKGLAAFEANRFDEAESLAKDALALHALWQPSDYRPEHLIAEIGAARAGAASVNRRAKSGVTNAIHTIDTGSEAVPSIPNVVPSTKKPAVAASSDERTKLLEQAIRELEAGKQADARKSIRRALDGLSPPGSETAAHAAPPKAANSLRAATSSALHDVAEPTLPVTDERMRRLAKARQAMDEVDESLEALHDRFNGDAAVKTADSEPRETRFRETSPKSTTVIGTPKVADAEMSRGEKSGETGGRSLRKVTYQKPADTAPPTRPEAYPKKRTSASKSAEEPSASSIVRPSASKLNGPGTPITPQIGWLESQSVPVNPNDPRQMGMPPGNGEWSSLGRNPHLAAPSGIPAQFQQDQKPGVIKRTWNAMKSGW